MSKLFVLDQKKLDDAIKNCAKRLVREKGKGDMNILFAGWYDYANGNVTLCFQDNKDGTITATYCCNSQMMFSTFESHVLEEPLPIS